ncbi:hypothetical protein [Phenylobacterium aquaticum]|nr:hypothetical protein [Phenylobacterium aquaticum]MCI3131858.1 hypothetical protein [Phenylobacterium aquaticum]
MKFTKIVLALAMTAALAGCNGKPGNVDGARLAKRHRRRLDGRRPHL